VVENSVRSGEAKQKLKVDIFVPLNACACMYEHFINQVFSTMMEYVRLIDFETKSLNSEEARKLNLHENCVVIDGKKIITSPILLKKELRAALKEKYLI